MALIAACSGPGLENDAFPTGSSTIVVSRSGKIANVNEDEGTLSLLDPDSRSVTTVSVGDWPARVAPVGDQLWVTLRGEGKIAVVEGAEVHKIEVSAEPFGIVATEDGKRVYVASPAEGRVLELHGRTETVLRSFAVPDQPRWLALHPSGHSLFVGSFLNGTLTRVDLRTGEPEPVPVPETVRFTSEGVVTLAPRITGDLAIAPDGAEVAAPMMYVDNETPVQSDPEEVDPKGEEFPEEFPEGGGGYGSTGLGVSRMNPALVTVNLDEDGAPEADGTEALFLGTSFFVGAQIIRSYPSSVAYSDSAYLVTAEGSHALYGVRRAGLRGRGGGGFDVTTVDTDGSGASGPSQPFTPSEEAGFDVHPVFPVTTAEGPRGIAMLDDETAFVHTFLDRSVATVEVGEVESQLRQLARDFFIDDTLAQATLPVEVEVSSLSDEVEAGRRLFYSALDARMAGAGAGVSCATCHFDVRNDGLTWTVDGLVRQTPSLAGPVSQTAPVTWSLEVESVAREAELTTAQRMGGEGLSTEESRSIEAFVETTPYPQPARRASDPLVREGEAAFAKAGCVSCHTGELYTDNASHEIFAGERMQTPTLRGVAASPPYFHDGSAPDLRAVLAMARGGAMGDTSVLTDRELDALVAFLESL